MNLSKAIEELANELVYHEISLRDLDSEIEDKLHIFNIAAWKQRLVKEFKFRI